MGPVRAAYPLLFLRPNLPPPRDSYTSLGNRSVIVLLSLHEINGCSGDTVFAAICLSSKTLQPLVSALNKPDITVLRHQQYSSQLIIHVEQPPSGGLSPLPRWPHYLSQKQTHCFLAWPAITLHWGSVTPTQLCGISISQLH